MKSGQRTRESIISRVGMVPWLYEFKFTKKSDISALCRLRTGHNRSVAHLFRMNLVDSPHCDCGMISTTNHIFFECESNSVATNALISGLITQKVHLPTSIDVLLRMKDSKIYRLILNFIKNSGCVV